MKVRVKKSFVLNTVSGPIVSLRETLSEFERTAVHAAMGITGNNKNRAEKLLGINRTTLVEKCRRYGLPMNKSPFRS